MIPPITLSISPNENNTKERVDDLVTALKSFPGTIIRISDDAGQPADWMLRYGANCCHVEVKDTNGSNDVWGSKGGHIGEQLVKLIDAGQPSFVVVCGSLEETLGEVPTLTTVKTKDGHRTQWAGKHSTEGNKTSLRALSADFAGVNVPIHYLSKNRVLSFKWALSYAKNILLGGNPLQWCPRYKGNAGKQKALIGGGIGEKNAKVLLDHFGTIQNIGNASYDDLLKCPGIGPERAIAIMERMH
jgi:hypothetical protein